MIQQLPAEAGKSASGDVVAVKASGAEAASDMKDVRSPETYVGADRAENFVSPGGVVPGAVHRRDTGTPRLNE